MTLQAPKLSAGQQVLAGAAQDGTISADEAEKLSASASTSELVAARDKLMATGLPQYNNIARSLSTIISSRASSEVDSVLQSAGSSIEKLSPLMNTPASAIQSKAGYTEKSLSSIQLPQQRYAATMELRSEAINRRNELGGAIAQVETAIKNTKSPAALTTLNQTLANLKSRQPEISTLISNLETSLGIGK
jgi:hypothetical protein